MTSQFSNIFHSNYLLVAVFILFYMIVWYVIAQFRKDNSVVDIAWGLGFVCISLVVEFFLNTEPNLILFAIVTVWGLRLASYIFVRGLKKGEDWRYEKWRKEWGKLAWIIAFFKVFLLQGLFMFIIALPLIHHNPELQKISGIQFLGLFLWLFGFLWEAIADFQLYQFKQDKKNQGNVMASGLWKFSRHPNYFGEIVLWWGIYFYTLPYNIWYVSLLSPVVITWLLMKVSGVPMLESKYKDNPEYQDYAENTNALFPMLF